MRWPHLSAELAPRDLIPWPWPERKPRASHTPRSHFWSARPLAPPEPPSSTDTKRFTTLRLP